MKLHTDHAELISMNSREWCDVTRCGLLLDVHLRPVDARIEARRVEEQTAVTGVQASADNA